MNINRTMPVSQQAPQPGQPLKPSSGPISNVANQQASQGVSPSPAPPSAANGNQPQRVFRRKQQTDPLVSARRQVRRPAPNAMRPGSQPGQSNGAAPASRPTQPSIIPIADVAAADAQVDEGPFRDIPLVTTKKAFLEGLRHHVLRLNVPSAWKEAGREVDVFDEGQFTRPIRLHRRDPNAPASGAGAVQGEDEDIKENPEEEKARERLEMQREERRRVREANAALIAPSVKQNKPQAFQKKTEQVYRHDDTPEARKKTQLRYEETLPWVLEDFDNKNTWVGLYEAVLSETHVMLIVDDSGRFRMVPLERWYKFLPKGRGKGFTADEADRQWQTKGKAPKWMVEGERAILKKEIEDRERSRSTRLFKRSGAREDDEMVGVGAGGFRRTEATDSNEIDFNIEEDFADDEEGDGGVIQGEDEEDAKLAKERIKREQLEANTFGMVDEKDVYKQEEEDTKAAELHKKLEKSVRKALMKREKKYDYQDDTDDDLFSESSDTEDTEAEKQKEEERKKEAERKQTEKPKSKEAEKDKTGSGASSKGNTTPSGRNKYLDPSKKSLKRGGSPNLSEASGSESARKKLKKKHNLAQDPASQPTQNLTLDLGSRNPSLSKARRGAGSGSETETTDSGRKKQKLKLRLGTSPDGTPGGSRAGSPAIQGGLSATQAPLSANKFPVSATSQSSRVASRAASPGLNTPLGRPSQAIHHDPLPPVEEIRSHIPPEGLLMSELIARYKNRKFEDKHAFIRRVKEAVNFDKATKKLFPKP